MLILSRGLIAQKRIQTLSTSISGNDTKNCLLREWILGTGSGLRLIMSPTARLDFSKTRRREDKWDRRGMVVGHVQSGKTANYTGLVCKAADAGYEGDYRDRRNSQ